MRRNFIFQRWNIAHYLMHWNRLKLWEIRHQLVIHAVVFWHFIHFQIHTTQTFFRLWALLPGHWWITSIVQEEGCSVGESWFGEKGLVVEVLTIGFENVCEVGQGCVLAGLPLVIVVRPSGWPLHHSWLGKRARASFSKHFKIYSIFEIKLMLSDIYDI